MSASKTMKSTKILVLESFKLYGMFPAAAWHVVNYSNIAYIVAPPS